MVTRARFLSLERRDLPTLIRSQKKPGHSMRVPRCTASALSAPLPDHAPLRTCNRNVPGLKSATDGPVEKPPVTFTVYVPGCNVAET